MSLERNAFRLTVAVAGCVPVFAGLGGALFGVDLFHGASGPDLDGLDSHLRYLSGLLLGVGLAAWATIPHPERHTARFRLLTPIVFLGGLARLYDALAEPQPIARTVLFALCMELVVTPLICLWQARIARQAQAA